MGRPVDKLIHCRSETVFFGDIRKTTDFHSSRIDRKILEIVNAQIKFSSAKVGVIDY